MWLFTEFGFFSIVAHRSKSGVMLVRGRVSADVVEFARRAGLGAECVVDVLDADYRYRLEVPTETASHVVSQALESIDYDNFKDRVAEAQGHERADAYLGVWSHLLRALRT